MIVGTSNSIEEFVAKQEAAARKLAALENSNNKPLRAAANTAKKVQTQFMAAAIGGDLRMSGVRGRIGIRYDFVAEGVVIKATGPAHLIERDTSSHWIAAKSKRGGRTRKMNAKFLDGGVLTGALSGGGGRIGSGLGRRGGRTGIKVPPNDSGWSMYARHPGTSGKAPFERGQRAVVHVVSPKLRADIFKELAEVYG